MTRLKSLLTAGLLIGATATASANFKCATSLKTTSFVFETHEGETLLTTHHANGVDFMPIHDGLIVPRDLPYLHSASTALKHMGAKNEFRFPADKCKKYGEGLIGCSGGEAKTLGGKRMQALNLVTKRITTEMYDMKVQSIKVTLNVNIEGFEPVQEITMEYAPEDCHFGR